MAWLMAEGPEWDVLNVIHGLALTWDRVCDPWRWGRLTLGYVLSSVREFLDSSSKNTTAKQEDPNTGLP